MIFEKCWDMLGTGGTKSFFFQSQSKLERIYSSYELSIVLLWCITKLVRVWRGGRGGGRGGGGRRGGRGSWGLRVKVSRSNNICVQDVHSAKFSFGNRNWHIRCNSNASTGDDSPSRLIHRFRRWNSWRRCWCSWWCGDLHFFLWLSIFRIEAINTTSIWGVRLPRNNLFVSSAFQAAANDGQNE